MKQERRHILTSSDMKILFDGFNETFFSCRIPRHITVKFVSSKSLKNVNKHYAADATWRPKTGEILIDETYKRSESVACILLLHEMAHAVLENTYVGHPSKNPGHGMIYQAELYRLFMAGAYDNLL